MLPSVLILQAHGTNRHLDLADAFTQAGAQSIVVPLTQLHTLQSTWSHYQILALPGGFSYADILGAGKLLAVSLTKQFNELLHDFLDKKKPIIGICNGFQALIKAGLLPNLAMTTQSPQATLSFNTQGHFECRWVTLTAHSPHCLWTRNLVGPIDCPVAHGEGRLVLSNPEVYSTLEMQGQIALRYSHADGQAAENGYPANPNGSSHDIAGLCNAEGNVLGLMPHPENHIFPWQRLHSPYQSLSRLGLALFQQGVRYVND